MCGSLEVKLTRYRRGNDPALFSFYSSIPTTMATWNLKDVIKAFKEKFPLKSGDADYNLVISHEKRVALNHSLNNAAYEAYKRTGGREGRKITIDETSKIKKKTQDYYCFPGQVLIGYSDCNKDIKNGYFYRVEEVDAYNVMLFSMDEDWYKPVSLKTMEEQLRLSHAMVYAAVQGRTFTGRVRLWDTGHRHFTRTHLLVGISRATSGELVDIGEK